MEVGDENTWFTECLPSILFWLVGWFFKKRTITRIEGGLLVACYIVYTAFLISQQ